MLHRVDASSTNAASPSALTIAGFDPSSGAGVTADLLVLSTHGVFATSAITALTVQSTVGVRAVHPVEADVLSHTLACLEEDLPPSGIKIGMLAGAEQVMIVAKYLESIRTKRAVTVVLDPVLRSSSGAHLLSEEGLRALQQCLLPLVDVVTPNLAEASVLTGLPCSSVEEMQVCAEALRQRYPQLRVLLTGGHIEPPNDLLVSGEGTVWMAGQRVETRATHGTGCAIASALLANRLKGSSWADAAQSAKDYVRAAMQTATPHGRGNGPMNLLHMPESCRNQISSEAKLRR